MKNTKCIMDLNQSCRLIYDRKSKVVAQWSGRRPVISLYFVSFQYDLRVGIVIEKMKNK